MYIKCSQCGEDHDPVTEEMLFGVFSLDICYICIRIHENAKQEQLHQTEVGNVSLQDIKED